MAGPSPWGEAKPRPPSFWARLGRPPGGHRGPGAQGGHSLLGHRRGERHRGGNLPSCWHYFKCSGVVHSFFFQSEPLFQKALRRAFDDARFPDLLSSQLVMKDIHSVSSLLKMYFRELPNPVCTFSLYDRFVSAVQSTDEDEERSYELRKVLGCLPKPNHRTLANLIRHLHRVSLHSDSTGMTAKNLAIVWAPNLLR